MNKDKLKWIIVFVLIAAIIVGVTVIGVKALKPKDEGKSLSSFSYKIGALDAEGNFQENTASIVTKDFIDVKDYATLKVEVKKEDVVKYCVFYYDANKALINTTGDLTEGTAVAKPENVAFVKVAITPLYDAEVSILEVTKYAGALRFTLSNEAVKQEPTNEQGSANEQGPGTQDATQSDPQNETGNNTEGNA